MDRNNSDRMDCAEFENLTRKVIKQLGSDSIRFFTTIHDMEAFFLAAETTFRKCPLTMKEFEEIGKNIAGFLGEEESARFFKAIYETIPQTVIHYLGLLIKLFEKAENYEIR
jgi:hypothetical protein